MSIRSPFVLAAAAALMLVLAACSGPGALSQDPSFDERASTLGTSSKLSWSYGSAVLSGMITGLGGTEVDVEGLAVGGYEAYCTNNGPNVPRGFMTTGTSYNDTRVAPDRRGSIKFGDNGKKSETEFSIPNQFGKPNGWQPVEPTSDYCSNGKGWTAWVQTNIFYINAIYLRFGTDGNWTNLSWSCVTMPLSDSEDEIGATLECTETGNGTPPGGWSAY